MELVWALVCVDGIWDVAQVEEVYAQRHRLMTYENYLDASDDAAAMNAVTLELAS